MPTYYVAWDTATGDFVSLEYAEEHPDTVIVEEFEVSAELDAALSEEEKAKIADYLQGQEEASAPEDQSS